MAHLLLFFMTLNASATLVQPGDGPYTRLRRSRTLYIYEPGSRAFIEQLAGYNQAFRQMYDVSFNWKLDEEQDLILASGRQQIANAYATTYPNIKSVWYPSGAGMLEQFAESSWLLTLAAHETSHLYQLNSKGPLSRALHPVFGNSPYIFPILPIFLQPNFLLPTSILEGNAVLNESRVNMGGRLHSGEKRALVLAQIAAGEIDSARLINDEFKFPFGENAYLQGGYFQAHLAAKFGVEKTNGFFLAHGDCYLWPLTINRTFREHFGTSYYQEVHEYLHEQSSLALKQVASPGEPLVTTIFNGPLNHDGARIWWLSDRGDAPPLLHIYAKNSRQMTTRQVDLPLGKVFFDGDLPLSAASAHNDLHHIEYSLYGEGERQDRRFVGQIVTDRRAGKTASLDARDSWLDPHIQIDGEAYDIGHSNPVLDEQGAVYYFRQNGAERLLYRNREPVFRFDGYYGKVTEVGSDGAVYFIGNTPLGSSLFRFSKGEIVRLLPSDRVVDARQISEREFLVIEVEAKGHRALIANASAVAQLPATYSYGFTTQTVIAEPGESQEQTAADERLYNAWREMRYNGLDILSYFSSYGSVGASLKATFSDPLDYQSLILGYSGDSTRYQQALVEYNFTKYLPQLYMRYWYRRDRWQHLDLGFQRAIENQVAVGMRLPIWRWRRWDASLDIAADYQHNDAPRDEETYGTLSKLALSWEVPSALGFYSWRNYRLTLQNRLDTEPGIFRKKHNTSQVATQYTHAFAQNFFASGFASYAWGENKDVDVDYFPYALLDTIHISRLTDHGNYTVQKAGALRLEVSKALTVNTYSARIPIGLTRVAPFAIGQGILMDIDASHLYPNSLFEWGYGADIELLIGHRYLARLRFLRAYDTRDPRFHEDQLQLVSRF